jgi:hypothetical protein
MPNTDPRKELYRLWFEFFRRAIAAGEVVDSDYYSEWLPIDGLTFDQWWRQFRPKLSYPEATVVNAGYSNSSDSFLIAVPREANKVAVLKQIRAILDRELPERVRHTYGRYVPTANSNIKYASFRLMLHCYDAEQTKDSKGRKVSRADRVLKVVERYKRIELKYSVGRRRIDKLPKSLNTERAIGVGTDDIVRNYYRSVQRARRIIKNVASGNFPGKYT